MHNPQKITLRIAIFLLFAISLIELAPRDVIPQEGCEISKPKTSRFGADEEIRGPDHVRCGNLIVFETDQAADWCMAPSASSVGKWAVDSSGRFLYFASTQPGEYTVCAAIVADGQPKVLFKTFQNHDERDTLPEPEPTPQPEPQPQDDLAAWITLKTQELARTAKFEQEKEMFASCFQTVVSGIEHGSIRSGASARGQLRICISSKLLTCPDASGKLWRQFLDQLSTEIERRCQSEPESTQKVKTVFNEIAQHLSNSSRARSAAQ